MPNEHDVSNECHRKPEEGDWTERNAKNTFSVWLRKWANQICHATAATAAQPPEAHLMHACMHACMHAAAAAAAAQNNAEFAKPYDRIIC
jgi:hypothetical protein